MGPRGWPLWIALAWAAAEPVPPAVAASAERVVHLRVDAVPVAPELMSICARWNLTCPGHGGPRTQTGAAFPVDGGLATNAHVVNGARRIQVVDDRGRINTIAPSRVRVDPDHDLAWLPVDGLGALAWADDDALRAGLTGWTVGYPDDTPKAVRRVTMKDTVDWTFGPHVAQALRRFDGPVRPGESGGPLLSEDGAVAAVVVAGSTPDSPIAGDGLAIPGGLARAALGGLARADGARRVGLHVRPVPDGVVVVSVTPGSPADRARVRVGDLLVSVDGDAASPALLARRVTSGAPHAWTLRRDGQGLTVQVEGASPTDGPGPALPSKAPVHRGPDGLYSLSLP